MNLSLGDMELMVESIDSHLEALDAEAPASRAQERSSLVNLRARIQDAIADRRMQ